MHSLIPLPLSAYGRESGGGGEFDRRNEGKESEDEMKDA